MYSIIFLGLISFALALFLTPLVRNMAWRFGVVDQPDPHRKLHSAPIPRMGGVAIFAAIVAAYCLLLAVRLSSRAILWEGLPLVFRLIPAFAVVFSIGLLDDIVSLKPQKKLTAEVIAAILAWLGGIRVGGLDGHAFSTIGAFAITVVWIVTCTNAINLIDGVDGLAAGVSMFAAITMLIAAILNHNVPMALAVVPLVGALLGFLRYNFNPASIFLGDCGSLTLGFLLGCYGAVWSEKSATLLGMTAPLLVLAVPLLDVGLAVLRRFLRGQPIFRADNAHIHHKLLSRGLTPRRLVLLIYGICGVCAAVSLLLTVSHDNNRGFVLVLLCLAVWLGLQHLGYTEFSAAGKMVLGGGVRTILSSQLALDAFQREARVDLSPEELCELVCRACPVFGFSGMVFHLDDLVQQWGVDFGWQARMDFPGRGYIILWRGSSADGRGGASVLFIDCLERVIHQKLTRLEVRQHERE